MSARENLNDLISGQMHPGDILSGLRLNWRDLSNINVMLYKKGSARFDAALFKWYLLSCFGEIPGA
jgi:hypothetical protein